jgi:uncharacterized membrane protein YphA (DoxX/SURF4 family)
VNILASEKFAKVQPWLTLIARLALGGILVVAGALKIPHPDKSAMSVRAYELLPISVANIFGYSLPWIEVGVGLLLIAGIAVRVNSLIGTVLMVMFIIAISQAWARGLSIDCGCFGSGGQVDPEDTRYLEEILRDIALAIAGIFAYKYPDGKFGLDSRNALRNESSITMSKEER